MSQETRPVIGILSIGDMGIGIAKLLISEGYRVVTYAEDRSERTRERARSNSVELLSSLSDFSTQSGCVLSIVPPRDALATAQRVLEALPQGREKPLYFLELNAISPGLSAQVEALFQDNKSAILLDGGIIGGPPSPNAGATTGWKCPSLVLSGPNELPYPDLILQLNMKHVSPKIGAASGLKMCFASMTKGFIALAIESFVTADSLGVLPELRREMEMHNAQGLAMADKGVTGMPPKAYRWVYEMQQIAATMHENGGFNKGMFDEVAEVYRVVAEDTELGLEQPGERNRGKTVNDVVDAMRSGMKNAK
ncbi:phosphogluconate dehydrogenase [Dactylonectria estremocensis]|uniref:Phosphogluconate dehydrogenase n=1 Tax=Dactylonectria estremocensis TaxID=1079267 RepID=A0A9P9EHY9_9HYPO|nr:phosphogluconate dehydrogenase [Dactylonectria estremocensis]